MTNEKFAAATAQAVAVPTDSNLLGEIIGCFDAALDEGLMDALLNTRDARLADLVTRRLMHAYYAAIGPSISPPSQEHATQLAGQGPAAPVAQSFETAPKDGTIVRLLVEFVDHPPGQSNVFNGAGPLEDTAGPCWTIGGNSFENTGINTWQFVGWNWSQDCFVDTSTDAGHLVLGWAPFTTESAPPLPAVPDAPAQAQGCTRSHPHENMSPMCVLRTEIARLNHAEAVAQALKGKP